MKSCEHLRIFNTSDNEDYYVCACTDSEYFLLHTTKDCNCCNFRKRTEQFPNDFISGLDTAITPETNIENLHAKIKYLNNQLNLKEYELKQLNEKFDDVKEKFEEIIYDYDTYGVIPYSGRKCMYEILGVNE